MLAGIKVAGWTGSILAILALIIALLNKIIGFIGFMTMIIKVGVVLLFVALFLGVGILAFRTWQSGKKSK
ncbi:MAG: hypothetical protein R2684_11300 [Pyrinomonadaceae bacterium]